MPMQVDVSEVRELAADFAALPAKVQAGVRPVVQKGALNIKEQLQSEMSRSRHFGQIARSISYDTTVDRDGIGAEIGPSKSRAGGALANIAYFGGSHGGGGSVPDPDGALRAEGDRFEKALADLIGGVL